MNTKDMSGSLKPATVMGNHAQAESYTKPAREKQGALSSRYRSPDETSHTPPRQQWRGFSVCSPDMD